ncbi:MAG: hypothetical protein WDZ63_05110 [Burkholderiales bacterium]
MKRNLRIILSLAALAVIAAALSMLYLMSGVGVDEAGAPPDAEAIERPETAPRPEAPPETAEPRPAIPSNGVPLDGPAPREPSSVPRPSRPANGETALPRPPAPSVDTGVYKVELGADAELRIPGPPGQLLVWIGAPTVESHIPEDMARTEGTLPAVGRTARITPFAPGLEVVPAESVCMQIHPRGSSTRFQLIPKTPGSFKVGAEVHLFDTTDCSGAPVPQAVTTLEVKVTVDRSRQVGEHAGELWTVFWNKLLEFWGALLVLLFGLVLFLIRKRLKKWFGYGD